MGRAEELRARYHAELEMCELEDQLVAAKDTDEGPPRDLKLALREARRRFREQRAGDADVSPDAVRAAAAVEEV